MLTVTPTLTQQGFEILQATIPYSLTLNALQIQRANVRATAISVNAIVNRMHQLIKPAPKPDHPPCCIRVNSQIPIQTRTEYTATKYNHYRDIWSKLRLPLTFNKKWTLHFTVNYAHDPIEQPCEVDQEFFNIFTTYIQQYVGT